MEVVEANAGLCSLFVQLEAGRVRSGDPESAEVSLSNADHPNTN